MGPPRASAGRLAGGFEVPGYIIGLLHAPVDLLDDVLVLQRGGHPFLVFGQRHSLTVQLLGDLRVVVVCPLRHLHLDLLSRRHPP